MRQFDNDYENLSALADNELREDQAAIYREKLRQSPAMREKYNDIQRVKKAVGDLPRLPEDHYFNTRLGEFIKEENKSVSRWKPFYKPAASLAAVTFVLMTFFSISPGFLDDLFERQKGNILDFYTKNLRPYFAKEELTKDDIFNFAFSQVLPIDSAGGNVISLDGSGGGASIAIREATLGDSKITLKEFTEKLNLNQEQKSKLDKVLKKYEDKIRKSILVNDNNTVAVNTNIWNYNAALKAEIMAIAAENKEAASVMPTSLLESMPAFASINFADDEGSFVCINPDTVFVMPIKVNTKDPVYNMPVANKVNIIKNTQVVLAPKKEKTGGYHAGHGDTSKIKKFRVYVDSNIIKFDMPDFSWGSGMPTIIDLRKIDSLVDLSMKNFETKFRFDTIPGGKGFNFDMKFDVPGKEHFYGFRIDTAKNGTAFDFNFPGLDSNGKIRIQIPDGLDKLPDMKSLGNLDSLMIFRKLDKDSVYQFNFPFNGLEGPDLKQFQEEMKKFREEMKKFREELKPVVPKKKEKKPVEV